jgi:hypothetical protein
LVEYVDDITKKGFLMPPLDTNTDFDPIQEVRHLRQELALRLAMLASKPSIEPKPEPTPDVHVTVPVSAESLNKQIQRTKRVLGFLQMPGKSRTSAALFKGRPQKTSQHSAVAEPQPISFVSQLQKHSESLLCRLERMNAGFTALGLVGIVFGVLCLVRGFDRDLSLGYPVCASGLTMILTGLGGYFLASPAKR